MRPLNKVFGSALFGIIATSVAGCIFLASCSDSAAKKTTTTTQRDASPYSPDPSYTNDPYPYPSTTTTVPYDAGNVPPTNESCDTTLDLTRVQGCQHFIANARACADNTSLQPYPFTSTESRDVVTCNGTNATCVQHCTTRCAHLPSGSPDECDHCTGKTDGTYCGSELLWQTKNANVLVRCRSGSIDTNSTAQVCNTCQAGTTQGTSRCIN